MAGNGSDTNAARHALRGSCCCTGNHLITHSEALDILAGRDAHEEDMEELVVGLMVVQMEFQACGRLFPAEATRSADRGFDLRMGWHWLELSGAS